MADPEVPADATLLSYRAVFDREGAAAGDLEARPGTCWCGPCRHRTAEPSSALVGLWSVETVTLS